MDKTGTIRQQDKLPATTSMGAVRLRVKDLAQELRFYTEGVGLTVVAETKKEILLGLAPVADKNQADPNVVLILEHDAQLRHPARTDAGLFHVAILFDTRHDLALSLLRTLHNYRERYQGPGDHLVSQAFYFSDPEGNGVELYWDRPRSEWTWQNGQVVMDTLFIDVADFIRQHLTEEEIVTTQTVEHRDYRLIGQVGHVHLQVGNIVTAHNFYVKALGFDQTSTMGHQALFVSAGGYHHHMAMNTWNSQGASPRTKTLGLGVVNLQLPEEETVQQAADRLKFHGIESTFTGESLQVLDPWNNLLLLSPAKPNS